MSYYGFRPYVPVAKRRLLAARELEKLKKKGHIVSPVVIEGRTIARNFWGKAWCENLERYSDYANRLPRGRTYVRNGSVVDLQIERGQVRAMVSGSDIYSVRIEIGTVSQARWKALCKDCLGSIGSLVELLQGKLSKNVMERVCREGDGLFPSPREIKMTCSCPDWAGMCKHVAAVMYGAGARLDIAPDLLFTLRGVDPSELIVNAGAVRAQSQQSCRGLLLSPTAEIDTRPQLEIHADEVKCAHGATTGRLDPDMLFYMLSRGLDRDTAQSLLVYAFLADTLTGMSVTSARAAIEGALIAQLPDSQALRNFR